MVTLLFRGEAITPSGLSQMDSLITDIGSDQQVSELLAPDNPVVAPSLLIGGALQVEGFESVDQAQIDSGPPGPPDSGSPGCHDRGRHRRYPGGHSYDSLAGHGRRAS